MTIDFNTLITDLVEAADRGDRDAINETVTLNPSIDWPHAFKTASVEAIGTGKFDAAVLLNRAWENAIRKPNMKSIRAAALRMALTDASDDDLLNEVKRRGLSL